jgi:predicted chitinase
MNTTELFNSIRSILGTLSQTQVDVINAILESCNKHGVTDYRHIAYILATGCHECNLKPVSESLESRNGRLYNIPDKKTGQIYYGRGCPSQVTLKSNYYTFNKLLGIDLINHPDLALQIDIGAEIGVIGMKLGAFTSKKLSDYFCAGTDQPIAARRIINGQDKAELIAQYYKTILEGILKP